MLAMAMSRIGLRVVAVGRYPAEGVEAAVDFGVGEIAAGGKIHEMRDVAGGRVER